MQQRTTELTSANQQLTLIDNRRKQFITDISHELRTPLTIIRGEAQVTLRQQNESIEVHRQTLESILEQALNLSRLVDDLLLLARAEMSQFKLELVQQDIIHMLVQTVNQWQRLYVSRDILLSKLNLAPEQTIMLSFDEQRIQQAVAIIMDNAVKYSPEDSSIEVNLELLNDELRISICDQGNGISPTEQEHIFERFVRFKSKTGGAGLGLSIAKAIISAHKGRISVESELGVGSTFTVTLPVGKIT